MLKYFAITTTILALVTPTHADNAGDDGDEKCGMTQTVRLGANVGKVLQKSGDIAICTSASGFNMLTASVLPSPDIMAKICDTPACGSSIGGLDGLDLPNCVLDVPLVDANLNFAKLLEDYQSACSGSSTSDSASGSTSDSNSATTSDSASRSTSDSASTSTSGSGLVSNSTSDSASASTSDSASASTSGSGSVSYSTSDSASASTSDSTSNSDEDDDDDDDDDEDEDK